MASNITLLQAFEAVVRRGSVAGAASELMVTSSAISHRLRKLEGELGLKLLTRDGRRLVPTSTGSRLAAPLIEGFGQISRAVAGIEHVEDRQPLAISMLHNVAVNWLLPRLEDFNAQHPGIEVKLVLTAEYLDFSPDTIDMAIRYSTGHWPNLYSVLLMSDRLTPVCSPEFLERHGPFTSASSLLDFPLITSSTRASDEWSEWLRHMKVDASSGRVHRIVLDSTHLALQAAANGLGFSIAGVKLSQPMLQRGALVSPFAESIPERGSYYIVCPRSHRNRDKIRQMRTWLISQSELAA